MATWLYQIDQENRSPQRYRCYARIARSQGSCRPLLGTAEPAPRPMVVGSAIYDVKAIGMTASAITGVVKNNLH